jgi:hypothetical protein
MLLSIAFTSLAAFFLARSVVTRWPVWWVRVLAALGAATAAFVATVLGSGLLMEAVGQFDGNLWGRIMGASLWVSAIAAIIGASARRAR